MSILINESHASRTVPLWASSGATGGGNPSTWANYPAIGDVDMAGNYISNAGKVQTPYIDSTTPFITSGKAQIYDSALLSGGGFGNGQEMYALVQTSIPDITASAPQYAVNLFPISTDPLNPSFTAGSSGLLIGDINSAPAFNFSQTDTSQQTFRATIGIQLISDAVSPIGLAFQLGYHDKALSPFGDMFNSTTPYTIPTQMFMPLGDGTYTISLSITDTFKFDGDLNNSGNPIVSGLMRLMISVYNNIYSAANITFLNIKYTVSLEPVIDVTVN